MRHSFWSLLIVICFEVIPPILLIAVAVKIMVVLYGTSEIEQLICQLGDVRTPQTTSGIPSTLLTTVTEVIGDAELILNDTFTEGLSTITEFAAGFKNEIDGPLLLT